MLADMTEKDKPETLKALTHLLFERKNLKGVDAALDTGYGP